MEHDFKSVASVYKVECCACGACAAVCPKNAVHMKLDELGAYYPTVDESCVRCGKCNTVCPAINSTRKNRPQVGFAAVSRVEHEKSASGGVFYTVAKEFLREGNSAVYGTALNEYLEALTVRADIPEVLTNMAGSKYVKSNIRNAFNLVQQDLEKGKRVLFSGSPCQIAAIKSYLGKEHDDLFTMDIVCHGMPGQGLFQRYLRWIESIKKKKVVAYRFRTKTGRDRDGFIAEATFDDHAKQSYVGKYDPYYGSFLDGEIFIEGCYSCKYACPERVGDITIGDWSTRGNSRFYDWRPVSIALINTEKGRALWDGVSHLFEAIPISLSTEIAGNKQLSQPSDIGMYKPHICQEMMNGDFAKIKERRIQSVPRKVRVEEKILMLIPFCVRKKLINVIKDMLLR